jgi:hypothetical protein
MARVELKVEFNILKFQEVENGHGKDGKIKTGSFFGKNVLVNDQKLNRGSLIDFLNSKATETHITLKKGWFFGLIGASENLEIENSLKALFPHVTVKVGSLADQISQVATNALPQSQLENLLEDVHRKLATFLNNEELASMSCVSKETRPVYKAELEKARKKEAGLLAESLKNNSSGVHIGYYRNASYTITNMIEALEKYAASGALDSQINPEGACGQGGSPQASTVGEAFKNALKDDVHGGFTQTLVILMQSNEHPNLIRAMQDVQLFLRKLKR